MKPTTKNRCQFQIPGHWTADQAEAIFEMLHHLADSIFDAYETEILQRFQDEIAGLKPYNYQPTGNSDDDPNDYIPF